jgi:hypothetical protein
VTRSLVRLLAACALTVSLAPVALAQDDDDSVLKPAEPDFTLLSLPTTLRLPAFKSAFRVTHRFHGPLKDSGLEDLFGIDAGATIGLEYRFGIVKNGQIGFYRTSDRTIELFGQYGLARQGGSLPLEVSALVAIEGTNNFKDSYSPVLGVLLSRRVNDVAAFYLEPMWVNNSNQLPKEVVDDNDTVMVGVGGRVRIRPTVYVVAEVTPRVSGYKPGVNHVSFGLEKRAGGHVFQLDFSNSDATRPAAMARGAFSNDNWYMGFNISRKFF